MGAQVGLRWQNPALRASPPGHPLLMATISPSTEFRERKLEL